MGKLTFREPLKNYDRISSDYKPRTHPITGKKQKMHNGIDYRVPIGNNVLASEGGKVVKVGENDKLGNVIIDHTPKAADKKPHLYTVYGHLRRKKGKEVPFAVKVGDTVERGQVIGYSGSTGKSTGPHLHFAVAYVSGKEKMPSGDGKTWIYPSEYSDPNKYIGQTHKLSGTTDDLTDEEADRLINEKISFELVYKAAFKFRMAVLVDGVVKGYIDDTNLNLDVELEYDDKELEKLMASPMPLPKKSAPINVDFNIKL